MSNLIGRLSRLSALNHVRHYRAIKGVFGNYSPPPVFDKLNPEPTQPSVVSFKENAVRVAFQTHGHRLCDLNLLESNHPTPSVQQISSEIGLELSQFADNNTELIDRLTQIYCGKIGFEFRHLSTHKEVQWFENIIENTANADTPDYDAQAVAKNLLRAEALDHFLAKKFQSVKRYGCEGAEPMITFVEELARFAHEDVDEIVIGMPHRGRLNLLLNTLQYPAAGLFHKLRGLPEFDFNNGPGKGFAIGDVTSHLYSQVPQSEKLTGITLLPNPSHLEVAGPMAVGYSRGRLLHDRNGQYSSKVNNIVMPLQIHGDASFTGQGIVAETLAMANVDHYSVGGSIHLVVNNQVGYTMPGKMRQGRSSRYCTDPVKVIAAPVIHVNASQPDQVSRAARIAYEYRHRFHKDIAVNLVCYRRWGHNELDDPTFTNPRLYKTIGEFTSIPESYSRSVGLSEEQIAAVRTEYSDKLNDALAKLDSYQAPKLPSITTGRGWANIEFASSQNITKWRTAVPEVALRRVAKASIATPNGFSLHSTLKRVFTSRETQLEKNMDWATGEALAFGSLLMDGYDVRISGQDVGRGTFSQRHCMLVDQDNEDVIVPLNNLTPGQLEVCNSILSEEAVIAFEYGLSVATQKVLPIWEAQFGDFFNAAQSVIDTLLTSGESKWLLQSGLTLLLPHGYDGAGPEHTSSKLERFLQTCNSSETVPDSDQINWTIAFPTTPAQYFHLLRRQMIRPYRKPLVVMSPKMLLRHPMAVSPLEDLTSPNAHFQAVLGDTEHRTLEQKAKVKTIVFCSGKHYYTLAEARAKQPDAGNVAFVRIEELCPFPTEELWNILTEHQNASNLVWSQEEHRNMGAWSFVEARFRNILKRQLKYAGRNVLEAPAVGVGAMHKKECEEIINETFAKCRADSH